MDPCEECHEPMGANDLVWSEDEAPKSHSCRHKKKKKQQQPQPQPQPQPQLQLQQHEQQHDQLQQQEEEKQQQQQQPSSSLSPVLDRSKRCYKCRLAREARLELQQLYKFRKLHPCYRCPSIIDFDTDAELKDHLETEHHCCVFCRRDFGGAEKLKKHNVSKHKKCVECDEYLASARDLDKHQHNHGEPGLECRSCFEMFESCVALIMHIEYENCRYLTAGLGRGNK